MKREHAASAKAFKQALNHCRISLATKQMFNILDIERYFGVDLAWPHQKTVPLSIKTFNIEVVPILEELHRGNPFHHKLLEHKPSDNGAVIDIPRSVDITDEVKSIYDKHPLDDTGWLPPRNPKQIAELYPAQTKASKDIAYKLHIEDRRGVMVRASVGVGKTYMYFQHIRWARDKGFFAGCISPWPCLIITKASIVEQTRRVGANEFGLDPIREFSVIHYDALRSSKGLETMIDMQYEVHGGIRYEVFKWRPFLHPRLIIVDECQAAKNENSQQSKIVAALSLVHQAPIKLVFSSATPFTRVSEAKYAVINMGIPYKML